MFNNNKFYFYFYYRRRTHTNTAKTTTTRRHSTLDIMLDTTVSLFMIRDNSNVYVWKIETIYVLLMLTCRY